MEFVHKPFEIGETIAAIATPPGEGGIAIIRISGKEAFSIADSIFSKKISSCATHTAHYGYVKDFSGRKIDEALVIIMKGRRSYTGEDTVEIQCHGGVIASKKILEVVLEAGARLATPGEFTFKAFMNGKIDLSQAEAVQQLIHAKNERALFHAGNHLEGALSEKISQFQKTITELTAILEASVDFPEEGLEFIGMDVFLQRLDRVISEMQTLLATFHDGRKIHYGISLCIVGCPNAGKSSLMNALLNKERAIVTPVAGTTRDLLEEDLLLNGLHFRLIDTAGIRESDEIVEIEGIRRTHLAMQSADLILLVLDANKPLAKEEDLLLSQLPKEKTVVIWNKVDLGELHICDLEFPYAVKVSAKEKWHLEDLKAAIDKVLWDKGAPEKGEVLITSYRQKEALNEAIAYCEKVKEGLIREISPEFLVFEFRQSLYALGTIIGSNISEDILSSIFSQFCVGK